MSNNSTTNTRANHNLTSGKSLRANEKEKKEFRAKDIIMFLRAALSARIKYTYEKGPSEDPALYDSTDVTKIWDHLDSKRPQSDTLPLEDLVLEELDDII